MRKRMTAIVLGVMVFSLIAASAASLGGINASEIGADSTVIASCHTTPDAITPVYTHAYSASASEYVVTEVDVTAIDALCNGEPNSVTLATPTGSETVTGTVSAGAALLTGFTISAEAVDHIAIVIG